MSVLISTNGATRPLSATDDLPPFKMWITYACFLAPMPGAVILTLQSFPSYPIIVLLNH